jgi:hypothetical protein
MNDDLEKDLEGYGRGLMETLSWHLGGLKKTMETLVRIVDVLTKVGTENLWILHHPVRRVLFI